MKYIILIILIFASILSAQINGSVHGFVKDADTGEPLPATNIHIVDTFLGTISEKDGRFTIDNLRPGEYDIKATFIGYKSETHTVVVRSSQKATVDFQLKPTALQAEQVIVTSSRQPEDLASAVESVNILGVDEIQRRNNFRIDEALLAVPGLTVVGENVNIRGGSGYNRLGGSRSLVLLDGVPILTSDLGAMNWNILPVTEIEHIEVLKGAASSLYGSGALSGVVNIMTKMPTQDWTMQFRTSSGMYDEPSVPEWKWTNDLLYFTRADMSVSKSYGPVGFRLAMSHHKSTGDRENGYFERFYLTGKTNIQLPKQSTLTLFATYSRDDRELFLQWLEQDRALNVPRAERGQSYQIDGFVGWAVYNKLFSPTLSTKIRLSYNQQLVGIPFNIQNAFTPAIGLSGEWQVNWKPVQSHSLSMGVDYKYDTVESEFYGKRDANGVSPYIQDTWKLSNVMQINAGARFDTYTLVGDSTEYQISPKIGFSYQPLFGTIFHGSVGKGFRAATVVERFIDVGSSDFKALPNPSLEPERSVLFDFGVRQTIGDFAYAEVTLFANSFENLIEPTLSQNLTASFLNYEKAQINGIETELRMQFWDERLKLKTSATWMDPKELKTNEPLLYRPRFIGFFAPSLQLGPSVLEADFRYQSTLEKLAIYPYDEQVPTKVWDVRWMYYWKNLTLQLMVRNALNYNYTVSERVLGEIRNFSVSLSGQF